MNVLPLKRRCPFGLVCSSAALRLIGGAWPVHIALLAVSVASFCAGLVFFLFCPPFLLGGCGGFRRLRGKNIGENEGAPLVGVDSCSPLQVLRQVPSVLQKASHLRARG